MSASGRMGSYVLVACNYSWRGGHSFPKCLVSDFCGRVFFILLQVPFVKSATLLTILASFKGGERSGCFVL